MESSTSSFKKMRKFALKCAKVGRLSEGDGAIVGEHLSPLWLALILERKWLILCKQGRAS